MQTTNDIFLDPSAIKTKIAGQFVDDTEQVWGKTKLFGVKHEKAPPITKSSPFLGYFFACDFVTSYTSDVNKWIESKPPDLLPPILFRYEEHNESYVQEYDSCRKCCPATFRDVEKGEGLNAARCGQNS